MPEHNTITDPEIHEPKGVSTAGAGQVYIADGAGSGTWTTLAQGTIIGFLDYNDAATGTTPLTVTGGAGWVYVNNDGLGAFTNKDYAPVGVTDVWDVLNNKFDWGELELGDMVDIRMDFDITTTVNNTDIQIALELATDGTSYDIQMEDRYVKSPSTIKVTPYQGIYMGDSGTLNNKARVKMQSDNTVTVRVHGWYCKVLINR